MWCWCLFVGEDNWGYESAAERWKPVHSATTIIVSVISMLSEGNDESPANVDAAVQWRNDYNGTSFQSVLFPTTSAHLWRNPRDKVMRVFSLILAYSLGRY